MKFQIMNRWTLAVQFECELEASLETANRFIQLGAAIKSAYKSGADLRGANLRGADLCGADLCGADLCGADLRGADLCGADLQLFPVQIIGHKHPMWTTQDGKLQIGCQVKTFEEWRAEAEGAGSEEDYSELDIEIYKLHIEHIEKISRLLWNRK